MAGCMTGCRPGRGCEKRGAGDGVVWGTSKGEGARAFTGVTDLAAAVAPTDGEGDGALLGVGVGILARGIGILAATMAS